MRLRLDTTARRIDVPGRKLLVTGPDGGRGPDRLRPAGHRHRRGPRPPAHRRARTRSGRRDGVHLLHSMGDTFALMRTLAETAPASAVIVGAGYIGLEMADALTTRGLAVTQIEQLPEVLPTVDPQLGALVHAELAARGVEVLTGTAVRSVSRAAPGAPGRLQVEAVTGARRAGHPARGPGAGRGRRPARHQPGGQRRAPALGAKGAIAVDRGDADRAARTSTPPATA